VTSCFRNDAVASPSFRNPQHSVRSLTPFLSSERATQATQFSFQYCAAHLRPHLLEFARVCHSARSCLACNAQYSLQSGAAVPPHRGAKSSDFKHFSCFRQKVVHNSDHMTRQQKIRDPLLNRILMPTIPTHQFPTRNTRLHQQRMQIPQSLRRLAIRSHQTISLWNFVWQIWKPELENLLEKCSQFHGE
jgi:hypothetical protein